MPISAIDRIRPKTSTVGWSRAAPATASTLSSDIDTSAMTIWVGRLREGLARRVVGDGAALVEIRVGKRFVGGVLLGCGGAQLAPHLPADPEQQDAADQQQAEDLQELQRDGGEADAQHGRGDDADQDRLAALLDGQAGGGEPDDDGVVPGKHEIDSDNLEQRREAGGRENFHQCEPCPGSAWW